MRILFKLFVIILLLCGLINIYVILSTKNTIVNKNKLTDNYDCILVLGAGIRNKSPSPMLEDRLLTAIELYKAGLSKKILVSGDHENYNYDEVNVMKDYLKENGIPSEDIFMDHAGLSTYDSIYRAKKIFKADKIIVVTQKYHLYRALYIANHLDLESYGISATKKEYASQTKRDIRELVARIKDFFQCIIKPEPVYMGEVIPISGNGDVTNDSE